MLLNMSLISSNALSCPFFFGVAAIKLRWDITMVDSNEMSLLEATYDSEAAKVCLPLRDSDVYIDARDERCETGKLPSRKGRRRRNELPKRNEGKLAEEKRLTKERRVVEERRST